MPINLSQFFARLERHSDRIPLADLQTALQELDVTTDELQEFIHFDDAEYQRNLIARGTGFEALLLCWSPGQRSPIHDHRGSSCGVKVIAGTATETTFVHTQKGLTPGATYERPTGGVCGSNDMDTHEIANLDPHGAPLITLHIYSPPLREVGNYTLNGETVSVQANHVRTADHADRSTTPAPLV